MYWPIGIVTPEEDYEEQRRMFHRAKERHNKIVDALKDMSADIEGIGQCPYVLH